MATREAMSEADCAAVIDTACLRTLMVGEPSEALVATLAGSPRSAPSHRHCTKPFAARYLLCWSTMTRGDTCYACARDNCARGVGAVGRAWRQRAQRRRVRLLSCARGCTLELVYCKALVYAAAASNGDLGGEQRNDMSWIASRDIAAPGVASVCCGCC